MQRRLLSTYLSRRRHSIFRARFCGHEGLRSLRSSYYGRALVLRRNTNLPYLLPPCRYNHPKADLLCDNSGRPHEFSYQECGAATRNPTFHKLSEISRAGTCCG
jgi:hypothetical protein